MVAACYVHCMFHGFVGMEAAVHELSHGTPFKRRKQMCNHARFVVIGHLILLGVFIYFQLWILIVVVTLGYFIATFPTRFCVLQQHLGMCPNVPDWRLSTRTVIFGPMTGFLYCI
jgi:hypothetical protein